MKFNWWNLNVNIFWFHSKYNVTIIIIETYGGKINKVIISKIINLKTILHLFFLKRKSILIRILYEYKEIVTINKLIIKERNMGRNQWKIVLKFFKVTDVRISGKIERSSHIHDIDIKFNETNENITIYSWIKKWSYNFYKKDLSNLNILKSNLLESTWN